MPISEMGKTVGEAGSEGKIHSSVYDVTFEMPMKHPGGAGEEGVDCMSLEFRREVWGKEIM